MKVERLEPTHPLAKMRLLAVLAVWADFWSLLLPPSARIVIAAPSGVLRKLQSGRVFQHAIQLFDGRVGGFLGLELNLDIQLRIVRVPYPRHGTVGAD
jgi:hypothetical protein